MSIPIPSDRDLAIHPPAGTFTPSMCPRMHWRSVNPALPPPDSIQCLLRGPDCCATSAVIDLRRVA